MTEPDTSGVTPTDPAACSLASGGLRERIGAWQTLAALALTRQFEQGRVRTTFPNSAPVARRLVELVDAEKECCSFLEFQVRERDGVLEVELRFPPEFAPMLAAVGAQ